MKPGIIAGAVVTVISFVLILIMHANGVTAESPHYPRSALFIAYIVFILTGTFTAVKWQQETE
jgi:NADH:ubiquinone oxidoreductase subunit 6 (subunit J)